MTIHSTYCIVYDYYTKKWLEGQMKEGEYFDVISEITLNKTSLILFANQIMEEQQKIEALIDRGICPNCHSSLTVKVYGIGYDDNPYEESEIVCDSCNWKG